MGIGPRTPQILTAALVCIVLFLLPASLPASDEDEEPAYMIYIDPETGKYTKQRPEGPEMAYVRGTEATGDARQPETPEPANAGDDDISEALRWAVTGILIAGFSFYFLRRKMKRG